MKCPTCGRRPSERNRFDGNGPDCPDPIHDLADEAPALKPRVEELEGDWSHLLGYLALCEKEDYTLEEAETAISAIRADLAEAVALLRELGEQETPVSEDDYAQYCALCGLFGGDHEDDCELAAFLARQGPSEEASDG